MSLDYPRLNTWKIETYKAIYLYLKQMNVLFPKFKEHQNETSYRGVLIKFCIINFNLCYSPGKSFTPALSI